MNYITTNIRIPEADYMRLKQEALSKRVSFSQIVRDRISDKKSGRSKQEINTILAKTRTYALKMGKKLPSFDIVKELRAIRYGGKW